MDSAAPASISRERSPSMRRQSSGSAGRTSSNNVLYAVIALLAELNEDGLKLVRAEVCNFCTPHAHTTTQASGLPDCSRYIARKLVEKDSQKSKPAAQADERCIELPAAEPITLRQHGQIAM